MTTLAQTKAIHVLRRSMPAFTDADYRALLLREFRCDSSRQLTFAQAGKLIDVLKALGGQHPQIRRASEIATGRFAKKLQALWISGYNLGVVRSRDDKALIAFVERQTGLSHVRFLNEAADAKRAIEALKSWLAREAGVDWPTGEDIDGAQAKAAVARAVARKLFDAGGFTPFMPGADFDACWADDVERYGKARCGCPAAFGYYAPRDWEQLANRLGARLRAMQAKSRRKQEAA